MSEPTPPPSPRVSNEEVEHWRKFGISRAARMMAEDLFHSRAEVVSLRARVRELEDNQVNFANQLVKDTQIIHEARTFLKTCELLQFDKFYGCRWCGLHKTKGHHSFCDITRFQEKISEYLKPEAS